MTVNVAETEVPVPVAVMTTVFCVVKIFRVFTVNETDEEPAGIVTLAGTVATLLPAESLMVIAVAAAPVSLTVPVEEVPPTTVLGLSVSKVSTGALTVSVVLCEAAPVVPVMSAPVSLTTGLVVIGKVVVLDPAGTVTVALTDAAELLLPSETTVPLGPALPLRVTVPVEEAPPVTLAGLTDSEAIVAAFTVNVALCEVVPVVPVMAAGVSVSTALVVMVNVAVLDPDCTVTFCGTVAAPLPLESVTVTPPIGAFPVRVTVPVEEAPPMTLVGLTDSEAMTGAVGGLMPSPVLTVTPP